MIIVSAQVLLVLTKSLDLDFGLGLDNLKLQCLKVWFTKKNTIYAP